MGDTLNLEIVAKMVDQVSGPAHQAEGSFGKLTGAFALGNIAANAVSTGISDLTGFIKESVKAAQDQEQSQAQLNAVLQSTHDVSGVTADAALKLSEQIQNMSPVSHQAALSAEDMLLTYTNIHKNVFPGATQAALDMATALNGGAVPSSQQARDAALQLGKALNDPATGMSRLQRMGVTFTAQQKEQAKAMEASGNMAGAQAIVLQELQKEFGGSAKAAGTTFAGSLQELNNKFTDMKEKTGEALMQGVTPLVMGLASHLPQIEAFGSQMADVGQKVFAYLKPALEELWKVIQVDLMPSLTKLWKEVLEPLAPVIGVILVVALKLLIEVLAIVVVSVSRVINIFSDMVHFLVGVGGSVYSALVGPWQNAFNFISGIINHIKSAIGGMGSAISGGLHALHIPGFATGVQNFSGGLAMVGEQGPELVHLPQGSSVYSNSQTQSMLASGGGSSGTQNTISIGQIVLSTPAAAQQFFTQLNQDTLNLGKGLTPNQGVF